MRHLRQKAIAFLLAGVMVLALAACGQDGAKTAELLVQGNIDEIYKGIFDPEYMKLVESTEEQSKQDYEAALEAEADFFASYYWSITDEDYGITYDDLDEGLKSEIVDLYREIYSKAKYEIVSTAKQDDGSYGVKMSIEPIDVMQKANEAYEAGYAPLEEFIAGYTSEEINEMSDEEYLAFRNQYGEIIVQLVKDQLPSLGYLEAKTLTLQVEEDKDGAVSINNDDWQTFDAYVIDYNAD